MSRGDKEMREVLFTGKRIDNGEWTYGYLFKCWGRCYLLWGMNGDNPIKEEVYPETVGEYTGLTDKQGKKIFEGYIVTYIGEVCVVEWDDETAKFVLKNENLLCDFEEVWCNRFKLKIEVIGNVHDNPELLEESDE